jgi:hypothetical protein
MKFKPLSSLLKPKYNDVHDLFSGEFDVELTDKVIDNILEMEEYKNNFTKKELKKFRADGYMFNTKRGTIVSKTQNF